jgi:hypothetical protein
MKNRNLQLVHQGCSKQGEIETAGDPGGEIRLVGGKGIPEHEGVRYLVGVQNLNDGNIQLGGRVRCLANLDLFDSALGNSHYSSPQR